MSRMYLILRHCQIERQCSRHHYDYIYIYILLSTHGENQSSRTRDVIEHTELFVRTVVCSGYDVPS
jgi:hypothetical protein